MRRSPVLTLLVVGLLAIGLLVANAAFAPDMPRRYADYLDASSPTPSAALTATPGTSPSAATLRFPASATYVAMIPLASGATMTLGITVDRDQAVAYACDGAAVESWFVGPITGGSALLRNGDGSAELTASLDGGGVSGALQVGGQTWTFMANPTVEPESGVYLLNENGIRSSWIRSDGGGAVGVTRGADQSRASAGPLPSAAHQVDGGDRNVF